MKWLIKKSQQPNQASIEEKQAEKLAQLGAKLADLRQQKGISLDEIVTMTRISRRLLNAIEMGNMKDLPEPIYIQGLIRQFAEVLGLKGVDFASDFPVGNQKVSFSRNQISQPLLQLRPVHLYLLYVFVVVCSVSGLSQLLNQSSLQANNNQNDIKLESKSSYTPERVKDKDVKEMKLEINLSKFKTAFMPQKQKKSEN